MAQKRIDVREAIGIAINNLTETYDLKQDEKPRLEETVQGENGIWEITLSFKQSGESQP
jgi:hypothetical protein